MNGMFLKGLGLCVVCLVMLAVQKSLRGEFAFAIRIGSTLLFSSLCISMSTPIIKLISENGSPETNKYCRIMLKALGVVFLTGICTDACHASGESGLADYAENIGKLQILLMSTPVFEEILQCIWEMLSF